MKLKTLIIYKQLIVIAHDILLRLMDIHRLENHIWRVFLAGNTLRQVIILISLVCRAAELTIDSIFEGSTQGHFLDFF